MLVKVFSTTKVRIFPGFAAARWMAVAPPRDLPITLIYRANTSHTTLPEKVIDANPLQTSFSLRRMRHC